MDDEISRYATFRCADCGALSVGFFERDREGWGTTVARWMPLPGTQQQESFSDVPPSVADAAAEAVLCMQARAPRGAILLARAVIEATAKDKGVTDGTLSEKIDQLHEGGYIRAYLRDGAHEVRYTGNDMAHGDFPATISEEDAEVLLQLMREVLMEVYQDPARRERLVRLARNARQAREMAEDPWADEPPF
ncbi:MAG TPA: DUF4145 domain-containing protein [Actinomycetes bacterium]|jgi:Domain of unknown function (DUF4145)|nr:DUF4145 domain-containing protein [Actinomycetes bacterium]